MPSEPQSPLPERPANPSSTHSVFAPLFIPNFRMVWSVWLAANTCMWMNDVAAAWLMTSLTPSPLWVALVQTAATLPVFLLGLPSGAAADIFDRRRFLMMTQFWVAAVGLTLALTTLMGWMNAPLLLALTFANGVGLALRWPVFAAIVPELVPRTQLPQALALNGVGMNVSRILGPLIAGALIAAAGSEWVFVLNATVSLIAGFLIMRWRRDHVESPLGRERMVSAIRVGVQFVSQSPRMRAVLLRISLFFFHSTALLALLPLAARGLPGGGAGTFTLLLACMGVGAIVAALAMPRVRQVLTGDSLILLGCVIQSAATLAVAYAPSVWLAAPAMLCAGMAWITVANTLTVSAQMGLPNWVRARGMSIYQMAIMGSSAFGAALWGQVATWTSIQFSLGIAAFTGVAAMMLAQHLVVDQAIEEDLTPSNAFRAPVAKEPPTVGRIQVQIEYLIDPARADEFVVLMQESRRSRMQQGALTWELLHDLGDPARYVEQVTDESWTEHLRRFDRVTASDAQLRERKLAFHVGDEAPKVTRYVLD